MSEKEDFCECIRLNEAAMYRLAFSIVKNDADAGEALSEAIYRAYKNRDTLKNKESFKPWILRIVHHTAVEMIRKSSKSICVDKIEDISVDSIESTVTTSFAVRNAVESLKQPYRTAVILFYYEGFSAAQIANITDSNTVTVKKQLSRARQMLRESLKEDFIYE